MPDGADNSFVHRRARFVRALVLSPSIILLASATRLLLISNYSTTTASTIASEVGVTGTLLGTVIPLVPPYLPVFLVAAVVTRRWVLSTFLAAGTLLISPAYSAGLLQSWEIAYNQFNMAYQLFRNEQWRELWTTYPWAVLSASAGVVVLVLVGPSMLGASESIVGLVLRLLLAVPYLLIVAALSSLLTMIIQVTYQVPFNHSVVSEIGRRPWLPPEEVLLKSGAVEVGYTIKQDVNWHIVLREEDRTVIYVKSDDIVSRTGCLPQGVAPERTQLPLVPAEGSRIVTDKPCRPAIPAT